MPRLALSAIGLLLAATCTCGLAADAPPRIPVLVDAPVGPGPFPAIVLAPGQGYHMELPAMQQTAKALVERGFAVYRFNWSYWIREPKGAPTADLSVEAQDFERVIAMARADGRVDPRRVAVGGKSLGSLVAWRVFQADPTLTTISLLTPVCSRQYSGDAAASAVAANYPNLSAEKRPVFFGLGDHDPLCEPKELYRYIGTAGGAVRISVVGGDHSFNSTNRDSAALVRNVGMVAAAVSDFAAQSELDQ